MIFQHPPLIGAIEAGGTKFVLACGTGPDDLRDLERIPTTTPAETLARCVDYFKAAAQKHAPLAALGIGTFGPAGVDPAKPDWGFITTTPKPGWQNADMGAMLGKALGIPVAFDTDVNAAGYGECLWGAGRGFGVVLYITVGTGIGGGAIINGQPLHGLLHPEMGHIRIPKPTSLAQFPGACPWHGDCLEGLASGPAIAARWGVPAGDLPPDHEAWDVRRLAADVLGRYGEGAVAPLRARLAVEDDPLVREAIGRALESMVGAHRSPLPTRGSYMPR